MPNTGTFGHHLYPTSEPDYVIKNIIRDDLIPIVIDITKGMPGAKYLDFLTFVKELMDLLNGSWWFKDT